MGNNKKWIKIWVSDYNTAQIIKTKLESENIPVHLKYESLGLVYGITVDGLGNVEIEVPSDMSEIAKEIIKFSQ